jgi:hypothetical protein
MIYVLCGPNYGCPIPLAVEFFLLPAITGRVLARETLVQSYSLITGTQNSHEPLSTVDCSQPMPNVPISSRHCVRACLFACVSRSLRRRAFSGPSDLNNR